MRNKLPGRTNTRKINPGKDPDGSVPLEDNSAEGVNSQSSKDKRHQTIRISGLCETYPSCFLIDSGATHNFVSLDFIQKHGLQHLLKPDKGCITFGNETKANSGYFADVKIQFNQDYSRVIRVYTGIKSLKHDLILGKPWHFDEEPKINWKTHEVIVDGVNIQTQDNTDCQEIKPEVHFISRRQFNRMRRHGDLETYAIILQDHINGDFKDKDLCAHSSRRSHERGGGQANEKLDKDLCAHLSRRTLERGGGQAQNKTFGVMEDTSPETLLKLVDSFADIFPDELPNGLPPQRHVDHSIPLEPNAKTPAQKLYRLSSHELNELKKQLNELIDKGWIQPSKSPYGAPVLFVAKKEGSLRMVVDYRALNSITIKDNYPLPRTDELFDQLQGARIFTKLDLRSGYHQIRVKPEDVPKTAFSTRYGLYEFTVLPFGLTSAPATFMRLMNDVFRDLLDICVIVYLDDILIYLKNEEEHNKHVKSVLERLREHKLYAKKQKCEFGVKRLEFLGHYIDEQGLHTDPQKVQAVVDWPPLRNTKDIQCFLGLANYYHRFIKNYSSIVHPLTRLLRKDTVWRWSSQEQQAFETLKQKLVSAPVLALPDPDKKFYVHTDASSTVSIGGILSQEQDDGKLHPVAYTSKSMTPAELNYSVYEQEMLALKHCLGKWRHHLDMKRFTVFTDNRALSSLKTNTNLNKRQIHWLELFMNFTYDVHYIPRDKNHGADALSKRPPNIPSHPEASKELQTIHRLHKLGSIEEQVKDKYDKDEFTKDLWDKLSCGIDVTNYILKDQLIYKCQEGKEHHQLVIPRMPSILRSILHDMHDMPSAGHRGIDATIERIERQYYWSNIAKSVRQYIGSCDSCQRNKGSNKKPAGLIQPLEPAQERWESISTDFITQLPLTKNGYDAIMVIVDRFSKRAHFAPCHTNDSAVDVAHIFLREVYRQHGLPKEVISDRDPKFTSRFWTALFNQLQIKKKMSTSYHPQSDGQTERINRILEDLLRHYVAYDQRDWDTWLPIVEHTYNNTHQASIKMTPYYCDLGRHVLTPTLLENTISRNETADHLASRLRNIRTTVIENIKAAAARQEQYANASRRDLEFTVGQ